MRTDNGGSIFLTLRVSQAMEEKRDYCFDCLQLQIKSDFSDQLVFNYGISASAFPFGSSAIVQVLYLSVSLSIFNFVFFASIYCLFLSFFGLL